MERVTSAPVFDHDLWKAWETTVSQSEHDGHIDNKCDAALSRSL